MRVADRVLQTMAFNRKSFKDRTLSILSGAITHFHMVQLAQLNHQSKWVQHWRSEIDRLVNMDFVVAILTEIKGKWDKRKAIQETLADIRSAEHRYINAAANYVAKVYKLKKIHRLVPQGIAEEFYDMVNEATESALSPDSVEEQP